MADGPEKELALLNLHSSSYIYGPWETRGRRNIKYSAIYPSLTRFLVFYDGASCSQRETNVKKNWFKIKNN